MSTRKLKPLKELLGGADTPVGRILERSAEIDTLTAEVRRLLPDSLRPHLLAANRRDETLCLVADSAVWAAKFRYHGPDILISLRGTQGPGLQKIRVSVSGSGIT